MNRREALSRVSILLGGAIVGADVFLSGCKTSGQKTGSFTAEDIVLLNEVGETIIPATPGAGGAKAAKVGQFMKTIVTDCYSDEEQKVFIDGIENLKKTCQSKYKKDFNNLSVAEKEAFLTDLHKEANDYVKTDTYKKAKETFDKQQDSWAEQEVTKGNFGALYLKKHYPPHYFAMMRQLTLWGYFSSETGMTQALRYVETPGHYDGNYPYKKGDKAWAL